MKLSSTVLILVAAVAGAYAVSTYQPKGEQEQLAANHWGNPNSSKSYILQGANPSHLNAVVANAGGNVSREFPIINAVSAMLTPKQADSIRDIGGIRIQDDRTVMTMANLSNINSLKNNKKSFQINNYIAEQTGANKLHEMGITGKGVTVAVVDSGSNMGGSIGRYIFRDTEGYQRVSVKYDAIRGRKTYYYNDDNNGHGTHITGIIASSLADADGKYNGIAPDVNMLSVRAFDADGKSSYSKVLDSLNWIYQNRYRYKIRVVNMSLGADVDSYYWNDPINQAVMRLWDAGIVVVTSAGNNGEVAGITVPGNNPYALTVGAVTDNYTPYDFSDDRITTFSSQGPTVEGFVKPEVVTYGARISSKMDERYFRNVLNLSGRGTNYTEISGTSQSSAIVAGVAALIISNDPYISANDVKCRIISSAQAATNGNKLSYSPFRQGAGLVNAYAATMSTASGCANTNLNIDEDLAGITHYAGPGRIDRKGNPYIDLGNGQILTEGTHWSGGVMNLEGTHWSGGVMNLEGTHWSGGVINLEGTHWSGGVINLEGTHWSGGVINLEGTHWSGGVMGLQGTHWSDGVMGLQGTDWSESIMQVQGTHWSGGVMNLEGTHWSGGVMNLETADLNPEPIDPNIIVPIDEDGWQ